MTETKEYKVYEKTLFMAALTFAAGFVNAYTSELYGGSVTFFTGNMMKMGVSFGKGDLKTGFTYVLMIITFIAGVLLSEMLKHSKGKYDWRTRALAIVVVYFVLVSFCNESLKTLVLFSFYAFAGYFLNLFRSWKGSVHNTTIATGNLRTVGANLYEAITKKGEAVNKFFKHFLVVFAFPFGAFISVKLIAGLGSGARFAILFDAALIAACCYVYNRAVNDEKA